MRLNKLKDIPVAARISERQDVKTQRFRCYRFSPATTAENSLHLLCQSRVVSILNRVMVLYKKHRLLEFLLVAE